MFLMASCSKPTQCNIALNVVDKSIVLFFKDQ